MPNAMGGIADAIRLILLSGFALVCIIVVGIIVCHVSESSSGKAVGFFMILCSILLLFKLLFGS